MEVQNGRIRFNGGEGGRRGKGGAGQVGWNPGNEVRETREGKKMKFLSEGALKLANTAAVNPTAANRHRCASLECTTPSV